MKKNKKSLFIGSGVVLLTALTLGVASLSDKDVVETSERPSNTDNTATKTEKKQTPASKESSQNSAEDIKGALANQKRQAQWLIDEDAPFSDRIQQGFYIVQEGDTLAEISKATGVPISNLRQINGINANEDVKPGWKLAVTPELIQDLTKEGSFPNLVKQAAKGQPGRYAYSAPIVQQAETEVDVPATPTAPTDVKPAKPSTPAVKPVVKPVVNEGQKPTAPIKDEDLKEETPDVDESPEVIDRDEEIETPDNGGSDEVIEETPGKDGDKDENTEIVDEVIIPSKPDVPAEGPVEGEKPGKPVEEVVDENTEVIPPIVPEEGEAGEPTPEVVRTTKTYTVTTPIAPGVEYRNDPEMPVGETRTVEGTAGSTVDTFKQILENGVVISESKVDSQYTASTPTIIYNGTKAPEVVQTIQKRTVTTVLEFGRIVRENSNLAKGETRTVQEGVNGKRTEIFQQILENGVLIKEDLQDTLVVDAIPEIVEVGTKENAPEVVKRTDTVLTRNAIVAPTEPVIEYSDELYVGQEKVKQQAKDGVKEITTKVYYENDVEISREIVSEVVVEEARSAIIIVGTKEIPEAPEVDTQIITEDVEIDAPETIIEYSDQLAKGEEKVKQEGSNGLSTIVYEVVFTDGIETGRTVLSETVVKAATPTIIVKGTKAVQTVKTIKERVDVAAPEAVIEYSNELALGEERVKQEARDGIKEITIDIVYEDGVEVARNVVSETVVQEAQAKIIVRGTKEDVVTTKTETNRVEIAQPKTITRQTNELLVGQQRVVQEGRVGIKEIVTTITYTNGVETGRDAIERVVETPMATIIEVGTKDRVETREEVETVVVAQPTTIRRDTSALERGQERIIQQGRAGEKQLITTITLTNGVETGRTTTEVVTKNAVATIIEVGIAPVTTVKEERTTVSTKPKTEITYNPYLNKNAQIVHNAGSERIVEQIVEITYKDGIEVSRKVIGEVVVQEGHAIQIEQGTRDAVDAADIPYLNLTDAEIYALASDPNNVNYEYREVILPSDPTDPLKGNLREALTERDVEAVNHGDAINELLLNQELLKLMNAERARLGIAALELDETLAIGTEQRALELAESGSIRPFDPFTGKAPTDDRGNALTHYRPYNPETGKYDPFYTAFNYRNDEPMYSVGENLAARTYSGNPYELNSEKMLAETFYTQWKNSPSHYQNMIADVYTGTWVSIKVEQTARYMGEQMNMYDIMIGAQTFAVDSHYIN